MLLWRYLPPEKIYSSLKHDGTDGTPNIDGTPIVEEDGTDRPDLEHVLVPLKCLGSEIYFRS